MDWRICYMFALYLFATLVVSKWVYEQVYEWVKSELAMTHVQEANNEQLTICK